MVLPVIVAAGIISVSAVFTLTALQVATTDTYVAAFGEVGADALVLLLLEIEHYGIFAARSSSACGLRPLATLLTGRGCSPSGSASPSLRRQSATWQTSLSHSF